MSTSYHHHDLASSLRAAAVELIAERGPAGFSLREVARRAGVSHAAPAHHFGDARGLLTAVAAEGFALLADAMRAAANRATDARTRLTECGRAYVTTALDNPGHYAVMVTHDYTDPTDPALQEASLGAYRLLLDAVEVLRDEHAPELDVDATATVLWCGVHGLVEIAPVLEQVAASTGTRATPIDDLIEHHTTLILDGVRSC